MLIFPNGKVRIPEFGENEIWALKGKKFEEIIMNPPCTNLYLSSQGAL
jgi:hypothetical protein